MTQQGLKDHVNTHKPFRPQCQFTACEKLFHNLQSLYDHEWRHYIPAPQRDELEFRQKTQNAEAPWKQKVKVEEIWLQNKKQQNEASNCEDFNKTHAQPCETSDQIQSSNTDIVQGVKTEDLPSQIHAADSQDLPTSDSGSAKNELTDESKAVNGYREETKDHMSEKKLSSFHTSAAMTATISKSRRKKPPVVSDPLNVREVEDLSTLSEGIQKTLGEPHITEHKSFHPKDPSYATFVKAPFIRPPPSTYLDESVLSMRKRRSAEEVPPRINAYWSYKKKESLAEKEQKRNTEPEQKVRTRCDKCLSSFSTFEELQRHQALNTCSALFGFDSDDESK